MYNAKEESEAVSSAHGADQDVKVLLVEDNPGDVGLMKVNLEETSHTNFRLFTSDRLESALEVMREARPDVVLLDLGLPDSNGLDTVKSMMGSAGPAPIVVLTGLSDESLGTDAVRLGAQDYLIKGKVDSDALDRAIRYAIQRKRILEELKESNDRYVSLFQDNHAVMYLVDPVSGEIIDANQAALDYYGYDRDELTSMRLTDLNVASPGEVFEEIGRSASQDRQHAFSRHRLADGELRDVEIYSGPIFLHGKTFLYSIVHDITERKLAEEARERLTREIERQHDLLQAVIDNAPFGIIVLGGADLRILWTNETMLNYAGNEMEGEDLKGRPLSELGFMRGGEGQKLLDAIKEVRQTGTAIVEKEVEMKTFMDRGTTYWQLVIVPLSPEEGVQDIVVMALDITEPVTARQRIEELAARADSERRRLKTILDNLPVGVLVADRTGKLLEKSDIVDSIWGGRAPLVSSISEYREYKAWWADTGMAVRPDEWTIARAVKKGETSVGEVIDIQRFDGTRGTIISSAAPIRDADGKVIGAVSVIQDITRQRKLEHDAIEAKEQTALYIDLLSHDISNLNAAVASYLQMALEKMDIEEKNKHYFTKPLDILENSNRLIENVRKIQQVEGHESKHGMVDLGWLLEDVRAEYEKFPGRDVKISYKTTIKKYVIASDLLKDVFTNLVSNAIKHSVGKVEISIILAKVFENGREYYKVSVEDDGPGIPDDMKSKLFQRKQRGRSKTAGTGLGLYLVKRLVEDFNGRVWVEDRVPGDHTEGSRFVVLLPAVTASEGRGSFP